MKKRKTIEQMAKDYYERIRYFGPVYDFSFTIERAYEAGYKAAMRKRKEVR